MLRTRTDEEEALRFIYDAGRTLSLNVHKRTVLAAVGYYGILRQKFGDSRDLASVCLLTATKLFETNCLHPRAIAKLFELVEANVCAMERRVFAESARWLTEINISKIVPPETKVKVAKRQRKTI